MTFARSTLIAVFAAASALTVLPGCAVTRGQSSVGEYIDDATVTASVKARFAKDKAVDATSISVETLDGTVLLSGFAKSAAEKSKAEELTRSVKGVKSIKNEILVRT